MDEPDLFTASAHERIDARAPLAARMRPRTLDDVVGQEHLVGPQGPLRRLIESDRLSSIIVWGPPGTGKTTLAELVASTTKTNFERLSAVTAGVKDIREVIEAARRRLTIDDRGTVVFVDEIHRFSTTQQDALLHAVESGLLTLVGATTENPAFSVNPALRSRSSVFALKPVSHEAIVELLGRACRAESVVADDEALELLAHRCTGDARQALTAFELAAALAAGDVVTTQHAMTALDTSVSRMGKDDHYDVISAFIKSMRASETDVALHWLARMIEAGEDPRFIARRMIIFASEDIGLADHTSLLVANAAAQSLDRVGLPEAQLNLAHAVVHLSRAPKSRAVSDAIFAALSDVREGRTGQAPPTTQQPPSFWPVGIGKLRYYGEGHELPHL
jgi:putative ATPase